MNLNQQYIRSLLAPVYQEACLDEQVNMISMAEILEYLGHMFESIEPHTVWEKINLDWSKYNKPAYIKLLSKLKLQYHEALAEHIVEKIHQEISDSGAEKAYQLWIKEYANALSQWNSVVYVRLCTEPFPFKDHKDDIIAYRSLNENILHGSWLSVKPEFLVLAGNKHLSQEDRSRFFIHLGNIELGYLLPEHNYDAAYSCFMQAKELNEGAHVERALGKYFLRQGDQKKARDCFQTAIELEPGNLWNYIFMGDSYRDEGRYEIAEQWYDDALHKNFLDSLSYRRKIILYGYANQLETKEKDIKDLVDKLESININSPLENSLYNTYRDLGFAYKITSDYQGSAEYYHKAIKTNPQLSLAHIDLGYILISDNKYDEAETNFRKALELKGETFEILWGLGYLYEQMQDFKKVIDCYEKCQALYPSPSANIFYRLGEAWEKMGDFGKAKKHLRSAFDLNPENARNFESLKEILIKQDSKNELLEIYGKRIESSPDNPWFHNDLGVLFFNQGNFSKSYDCFFKAFELDQNQSTYYYNLGVVLIELGKIEEAIEQYQKALQLNPEDSLACNGLGNALQDQGKIEEAIEQYQKALQLDPDHYNAYNGLGNALQKLGKNDEAIIQYKKALDLNPEYALAYNGLGNSYHDLGKIGEAMELYQKALELDPELFYAYNNLGNALQQQGEFVEAEKHYKKALQLSPDYTFALNGLGNVLAAQGKNEEAVSSYQKVLKIDSKFFYAYVGVGNIMVETGKNKEAIEHYDKALQIYPEYPYAFNGIGNALMKLGRKEEAIVHYKKAVQLDPTFFYAFNGLGNAFLEQGKNKEAMEYYQKGLALEPRSYNCNNGLGFAYLVDMKFDKAREYLEKAWEYSGENSEYALMNLGHTELLLGNIEKAVEHYKKSMSMWRNKTEFLDNMDKDYTFLKMEKNGISPAEFDGILQSIEN